MLRTNCRKVQWDSVEKNKLPLRIQRWIEHSCLWVQYKYFSTFQTNSKYKWWTKMVGITLVGASCLHKMITQSVWKISPINVTLSCKSLFICTGRNNYLPTSVPITVNSESVWSATRRAHSEARICGTQILLCVSCETCLDRSLRLSRTYFFIYRMGMTKNCCDGQVT